MKRVIVLYIPVIHEGYIQFLKKYAPSTETVYIAGAEIVAEHTFLAREIRAVDPETIRSLVEHLGIVRDVRLLDAEAARALNTPDTEVVTADEAISKRIAAAHFPQATLVVDRVFLRWDEANVLSQKVPDTAKTSTNPTDISFMKRAWERGQQSSCWWRQVGAMIVKNGEVLLELHNRHVPSPHAPYAHGDPRDVV
ncbi:MAG: hypothetical protein RL141_1064, partial [Candidatus Parcubacteria bacterium]